MKVIINLLQCHREYTGTGRYVRNICQELARLAPDAEFLQLVAPENAETYFVNAPNFNQLRLPVDMKRRIRRIAFEQTLLPIRGLRLIRSPTVLWSPNDVPVISWPGRQVVTIHDLRRELLPDQFEPFERLYYRLMMRIAVRSAARVLTVSECSRQDIHRHYGMALDRIHVTYNAVDPDLTREPDDTRVQPVLSRYGLRKPYVLFVGQQMQIKGPHVLVDALARVRQSQPELSLVLVGKSGNATPLIQSAIQRFGLADAVRLVPWVSDEDLRCLYSGAAIMAFPSRYEGFGIPVLEAMRCGTPVITSRYSCLPEIAGDAAHYLEDLDPATIADALTSVLNDSALRRGLVERGLVNASRFTWQRSAQQVLEALTLAAHRD